MISTCGGASGLMFSHITPSLAAAGIVSGSTLTPAAGAASTVTGPSHP
jgi:hypothetical protein